MSTAVLELVGVTTASQMAGKNGPYVLVTLADGRSASCFDSKYFSFIRPGQMAMMRIEKSKDGRYNNIVEVAPSGQQTFPSAQAPNTPIQGPQVVDPASPLHEVALRAAALAFRQLEPGETEVSILEYGHRVRLLADIYWEWLSGEVMEPPKP